MSTFKLKSSSLVVSISTAVVFATIIPSIYLIFLNNKYKKQDKKNERTPAPSEDNVKSLQKDFSIGLPEHIEREVKKERRRQAKMKDLAMKSPMYDNVTMIDPDGKLLSSISGKKGKWYVERNLARWTNESHTCIQLLFEPKGRVTDHDEKHSMEVYTLTQKHNQCVVCGSTRHMMRLYVVPYAYRTILPNKYKSHMSHDIVILCGNCNLQYQRQYQIRMNELEENLRPVGTKQKFEVNQELYKIRSCALALLRWKEKLPPEKISEYERLLRKYLSSLLNNNGIDKNDNDDTHSCYTDDYLELKPDTLQKLANIHYKIPNPHYTPGPKLVVQSLENDDTKIEQFVKEWRIYFMSIAHPRHLPNGWSVDNPVASEGN